MNITLIGAGNLGSAILDGLINAGFSRQHIWATTGSREQLHQLEKRLGIHGSIDNIEATAGADIVILAVKPQIMPAVVAELTTTICQRQPLIISVAAGVPVKFFQQHFGQQSAIVRAMPNTPATVQASATALYANAQVTPGQREQAEKIFNSIGISIWLDDEAQLNLVTAITGSGPAYFFSLLEALESTAMQLGLPQHIAKPLILQTALGSARMASDCKESVDALRKKVTSPGGGTEQALKVLEQGGFNTLILHAVQAALQRYEELGAIER